MTDVFKGKKIKIFIVLSIIELNQFKCHFNLTFIYMMQN